MNVVGNLGHTFGYPIYRILIFLLIDVDVLVYENRQPRVPFNGMEYRLVVKVC